MQTYRGCFSFLHRAQLSVLLALVAKDTIGPGLLGGTRLRRRCSIRVNFFVSEETDSEAMCSEVDESQEIFVVRNL